MTTLRPSLEEFWAACVAAQPQATAGRSYRLRSFGRDPVLARRILDLIVAREKTGTFAVDWEFESRPADRPQPGDLYIVTDHEGQPGALIRITATEVLPYRAIDERHIACEGPALRSLGPWRELHWNFWRGVLMPLGREPAEDMPVLWQRFELLYAPAVPR